ncbi:MAG: 2,3-diphosphoglycerate-dependent phosphoglycerate mutase [Gammaproteobacteria bacterium]|nr:MAG: 2,3-diphosphoglycerate-dependent phosphoglycerate mutase [Gammaproteobacteria bacterium]
MKKLVLVRHGQSEWNLQNRFTGWKDVDLSPKGIEEAKAAGALLKEKGYSFDHAFSSYQTRAIRTCLTILDELDELWIPMTKSWKLNERHYGALQGLNKSETVEKHGEEQVHIWRRSYDITPPPLEENDERHAKFDPRYKDLDPSDIPATESLATTLVRVLPYWEETIVPVLKKSDSIIIAAHGNSLRALIKHLDNIANDKITSLEIPTGQPLVYEMSDDLNVIESYYLSEK